MMTSSLEAKLTLSQQQKNPVRRLSLWCVWLSCCWVCALPALPACPTYSVLQAAAFAFLSKNPICTLQGFGSLTSDGAGGKRFSLQQSEFSLARAC